MSTSKPKPKRVEKKLEEKIEISGEILMRTTVDLEDLIRHVKSEVERGNVKYYTPYTLAQTLNIKISDAKKVLKEAVKQGILRLHSGGRRSPVYVPTSVKTPHETKAK